MSLEVQLGAIRLEFTDQKLFNLLLRNISEEKRAKILKIRRKDDRMRALFADILVRTMICKNNQCKNDQIHFEYNSYGKPFLTGISDIYFNVSHSAEWVVVALSTARVGIDIEEIKMLDYRSIAERYFSNIEAKDILKKKDNQQLEYFYILWTLKESFVKNSGWGLSKPLNSFSITINKKNAYVLNDNGQISTEYHFLHWPIDSEHYSCSICVKEDSKSIKLFKTIFTQKELVTDFKQYI
ncbi:4'-phosphopantetheinyl transferase superfamily protein (plasmid) [Alkalihalophilus pseudofirmus]|uniref:4'-phosphopantetheinyl transferase family protein n=1 Tax=Alkalihalophilus pseudofirmus TaxID=79885 RepID=UPI00259B4848|nr:4'-phosphopantetheinyl transferase superfamily protein [Alkalihalophilus pseudofirmus]WEG19172.1 4'-phosphopantetheinyl transferase superfamily protein [Alkalihalophilus pseudofirmus]